MSDFYQILDSKTKLIFRFVFSPFLNQFGGAYIILNEFDTKIDIFNGSGEINIQRYYIFKILFMNV